MNAQLLADSLFATNDPDGDQFGPVETLAQLNRVIREIHRELIVRESSLAGSQATLTTTSGTSTLTLPEDFWRIVAPDQVGYVSGHGYLSLISWKDAFDPARGENGPPFYCFLSGLTTLNLVPTPDDAYTIYLPYFTSAPELTLTGYSAANDPGATAILEGNDTPWGGLFDDAIIPAVEALLLAREEYDVRDLLLRQGASFNLAMEVAEGNTETNITMAGADIEQGLG